MKNYSSIGNDRRGVVGQLVVFSLVAVALVSGAIYYYLANVASKESKIQPILATVAKGEFVSQVLDQGEVQSSENVEIRCEVSARNGSLSVIQVCQEGALVKEGDFLVRLDTSSFDKELEQQKIKVATAETAVIKAKAAVQAAEASRKEYIEGVFIEGLKMIENEIFDAQSAIETANQELVQAKAVFEHTKKLLSKGFVTNQQLAAEDFAVNKAKLSLAKGQNMLELGNTKKRVLMEITKEKELIQLNSDIEAANVAYANEMESKKVEEGQLQEIKDLIKKCEIVVPPGVSGQVVFAKESSRGGQDWVLEEGTAVRERQVLIRLPDPSKMEVKALINEQSITQIEPGMPCSIEVDALTDQTLKGIVTKVNQYAESSGWMSSSVRKYAVFVKILDPPPALKPGMNASVNIQVRYEQDALLAPLQTVYAVQDKQFCLVKKGDNQWETREVQIGGDNSEMVLIDGGVEEGEQLVMNPGGYKSIMDLPEMKLDTRIELPEGAEQEMNAAREAAAKKARPQPGQMAGGSDAGGSDGPGAGNAPGGGDRGGRGGGRPGGGGGGPGGGGGGPGGGAGGFSMSAMVDRMMERYDTNGDGSIDKDEQAEVSERAKPMIANADTDGDGSISRDEMTKASEAMMKRFQGGGGGGGPGGGGE